jgi:predicted DNA-binding transcriptional regulator AlpA
MTFAAIPPKVLLELGRAFGAATPEMSPSEHYDQAMFHLVSYAAGDNADPTLGVSHLALAMKHTALLLGADQPKTNPTMQGALAQGAMFNQTSQPQAPAPAAEPEQPQPPATVEPEQPKPPVRMTGDGWVIHEYEPGVTLSTEQARERAGISKSQFAKLLQAQEFVRPMGVVIMASGQKAKVYAADDVDKWVSMRATGTAKKRAETLTSPEAVAKRLAARERNDALPEVKWAEVLLGKYYTIEQLTERLGVSKSHIYTLQQKGEFPYGHGRSKDPHQTGGMQSVLYNVETVEDWIKTSQSPTAFRVRKRLASKSDDAGTAVDGSAPEPDRVASETLVNGQGWAGPEVAGKLASIGKVSQPAKQWLNLREVADFLGMTETAVERMVRDGKFPKAHKQNTRLHIREWGGRQVAKWKRENVETGALVK